MNDKIKVSTREGLLAFMTHALGFTPSESLVFITLADNKVGATLRVDIPAGNNEFVARYVTEALRRHREATATIMAVYTDAPGDYPHAALVKVLEMELLVAGMPIKDALLVTSAGWRVYFDAAAPVSAPDTITDSAANAALIFSGSDPEAGKPRNPEFTGVLGNARTIAVLAANLVDVDPLDMSAPVMREARAAWTRALGTVPDNKDACLLVAYMQNRMIRDRMLADFFSTNEQEFSAILVGDLTTCPTWARADQAQTLLVELLSQTPDKFRAPLFTALGFIAWYKGQATLADQYFRLALDIDPDYELAKLLVQIAGLGILPQVALNAETAYRREV